MWTYITGIAFKLVGAWLDKNNASVDVKRKWLDFIDAVDQSSLDSSRVLSSYQDQLKALRVEREAKPK